MFAGDERVAMPLAVAIRTTLERLSRTAGPRLYVLDGGISRASLGKLHNAAEGGRSDLVVLRVPHRRLDGLQRSARFTPTTFARLLIAELLPAAVARAVYLDADILVRRDLSPLLSVDLHGAPIGAVRDFLPQSTPHFNSGVMVMDLPQWRRHHLGARVIEQHISDPLGITDQEALNALITNWHELDYQWNVQHGNLFFAGMHGLAPRPEGDAFTDELITRRWQLYRRAAVLHFVGGVKPWQPLCPLPGTTAWTLALMRTGFLAPSEALRLLWRSSQARCRYAIGTARRGRPRSRSSPTLLGEFPR